MKNLLGFCVVTMLLALLPACSETPNPPDKATLENSAATRIQEIPPANPKAFEKLKDMGGWRNPYLILRKDGVGLFDAANYEQHIVKPDDLLQALAQLPPSAWPYGRVVAVQENGVKGTTEDDAQVRKNRALVAGTLQSAHVVIRWVPASLNPKTR